MPLPPLPAHTTPRYRLMYTHSGIAHAFIVHQALQTSAATALSNATALANLLKPLQVSDCVYTGVQFADAGSDVFNDVGTLNIAGTNSTLPSAQFRPYYMNFAGRGTSGRKTRLFVFGVPIGSDMNYRVTSAEWATIATIVAGLNGGTGGVALIDASTTITWKPYANVGVNHRYVVRIRRSG